MSLKAILMDVAMYYAPIAGVVTLLFRALDPSLGPIVRAKFPRLAHVAAAIIAMSPDFLPFLKAIYKAIVGQPFPAAPAMAAKKEQA